MMVVTAIAVTTIVGCNQPTVPVHSDGGAPAERWVALPRLRQDASRNPDGAGLVTVEGRLWVATVQRSTNETTSRVVAFERSAGAWRLGAPRLRVDRDARVDVIGGMNLCVVSTRRQRVVVWCLDGAHWQRSRLPATDPLVGAPMFDDAARIPGGIGVLVTSRRPSSGRFDTVMMGLDGSGRWRQVGGDIAAPYARGSQRPYFASAMGRLCVAFDGIPTDPTGGPDVSASCLASAGWRSEPQVAVAPHIGAADALQRRPPQLMISGAASVGGVVNVGVVRYTDDAAEWTIERREDRAWTTIATPAPGADWHSQGDLYDVDAKLWAIRFDQATQSPTLADLRTRLVVLKEERNGRMVQVGAPLRVASRFYGPLYYGLVDSGHRIFAMATVPSNTGSGDEVRVFELRSSRGE